MREREVEEEGEVGGLIRKNGARDRLSALQLLDLEMIRDETPSINSRKLYRVQ